MAGDLLTSGSLSLSLAAGPAVETSPAEVYRAFVPPWLLADVLGGAAPEPQDRHAATMFVDIAGFTALTMEHAEEGGAEGVGRLLNLVLGEVVAAVRVAGGEILGFAGDGLLAAWSCDPTDPVCRGRSLSRAVHCAVRVASRSAGGKAPMRVGIGGGLVRLAPVGGMRERYEVATVGPAVVGAITAQRHADPGTVQLAPELWQALGRPERAGTPFREGDLPPLVPLEAVTESPAPCRATVDRVRPFVPGAVRARVDAGHVAWLAEFRRVSCLFVNLPEIDAAGPPPPGMLQDVVATVQSALYEFEGSLDKLMVDDKGISLLGVLGLPPLSHADDPARATEAALLLRDELEDQGIRCRIGVATGRVFAGTVGTPERLGYTVAGATVNRSARLAQAAGSGSILVDEPTWASAGRRLEFDSADPVHAKGMAEPVPVFRPRGGGTTTSLLIAWDEDCAATLFGRQEARWSLGATLERFRFSGEGELVVVEGQPGMGKSALLAEASFRARRQGLEVLRAAGDPLGRGDPETTLTAKALRWARQAAGPVLFCDDADGLDDAARAVLLRLLAEVPTVHVVLAAAELDDALHDELRATAGRRSQTWLELTALDEASARDLVADVLDVAVLDDEVATYLLGRGEASPAHLRQVTRSALEGGLVLREGGRVYLSPAADGRAEQVPTEMEAALVARIDRLDPGAQLTVKVASVLGETVSPARLRTVLPDAAVRVQLDIHLAALREARLLRSEPGPGATVQWSFTGALVRETAYRLMAGDLRRRVHGRVARLLERNIAKGAAVDLRGLAHHWHEAGDDGKAAVALELAGRRARSEQDFGEAAAAFERAVALLQEDDPRRTAMMAHLPEACILAGESGRGIRHATAALRSVGIRVRDGAGWRGALAAAGEAARWLIQRLTRARPAADPRVRADAAVAARVLSDLSWARGFQLEPVGAVWAALRAHRAALRSGGPDELFAGHSTLAAVCAMAGLRPLGRLHLDRAGELLGEARERGPGCATMALFPATVADWEGARGLLQLSLEALGGGRSRTLHALVETTLGRAERCAGNLDRALELARRGAEPVPASGPPLARLWGTIVEAGVLLDLGRVEEATARIGEATALERRWRDRLSRDVACSAVAFRAIAAALDGRFGDASSCLARLDGVSLEFADGTPWSLVLEPVAFAGFAILDACDRAEPDVSTDAVPDSEACAVALRAIKRAVAGLRMQARRWPVRRPTAARWHGRLLLHRGRRRAAARVFRRGRAAAAALGMPWEEAVLTAELARVAPPAEAVGLLDAARAGLAALGADPARVLALHAAAEPARLGDP